MSDPSVSDPPPPAPAGGFALNEAARAAPRADLPLRVALASMVAFWSLYFVILTVRALAIYRIHSGMGSRALVSLASVGVTFLLYLVLRRIAIARLGRAIAVAALLAAPAALLYSTINYVIFTAMPISDEARPPPIPPPAAPPHAASAPLGLAAPPGAPASAAPLVPPVPAAQPAPPAPPQTMTVGTVAAGWDEPQMSAWMMIGDNAANGYFFLASWAALYLALCFAGEVGRLARRAAVLQAAAQAAELRALRYQVNPHFLFNTLNSLSSLVMTGRHAAAERMIANLAAFFRTSLTGDPSDDVHLGEEIALQRLYLDIEAIRFPDRLRVAIELPPRLETACVPGLILQPLIENAVKHGVARTRRPVELRIVAAEQAGSLVLRVEDDAEALPGQIGGAPEGTGVGLANVRDRLRARYGEAAYCWWARREGGGFVVMLAMPLVLDRC